MDIGESQEGLCLPANPKEKGHGKSFEYSVCVPKTAFTKHDKDTQDLDFQEKTLRTLEVTRDEGLSLATEATVHSSDVIGKPLSQNPTALGYHSDVQQIFCASETTFSLLDSRDPCASLLKSQIGNLQSKNTKSKPCPT